MQVSPKEEQIKSLFNKIARQYDLLTSLLCFNRDKYWRRVAADAAKIAEGDQILDVCCGTGKLTLEIAKRLGANGLVTGLDFSAEMLSVARAKLNNSPYREQVALIEGNAMSLPFPEHSFDAATSAFSLRSVPDIAQAISEMRRVVRPGGRVVVVDLAKPGLPVFQQASHFYSEKVAPWLGRRGIIMSGPRKWLPESLLRFPSQKEIAGVFAAAGLREISCRELTGGIVAVYVGVK